MVKRLARAMVLIIIQSETGWFGVPSGGLSVDAVKHFYCLFLANGVALSSFAMFAIEVPDPGAGR